MKLQRIQQIEEYIKKHRSASLNELCQRFEVSKNTIRRDIQHLEARHFVRKVYGGVVLNSEEPPIPPLAQRQMTMRTEKERIARKAAEFVHDGDIIVIDSGSTTVHMVDHLREKQNLTIITNSVPVINVALAYQQLRVIVTGGDLLRRTDSLVGLDAISMLKKLNAKTVFLAAPGVSLTKGITNHSTIESEIKRAMYDVSARRILLVDHSKFDTVSLVTLVELKEIDVLITDQTPPADYLAYCQTHRVRVVVAGD